MSLSPVSVHRAAQVGSVVWHVWTCVYLTRWPCCWNVSRTHWRRLPVSPVDVARTGKSQTDLSLHKVSASINVWWNTPTQWSSNSSLYWTKEEKVQRFVLAYYLCKASGLKVCLCEDYWKNKWNHYSPASGLHESFIFWIHQHNNYTRTHTLQTILHTTPVVYVCVVCIFVSGCVWRCVCESVLII